MLLFPLIFSMIASVIFWLGLNIFSSMDYEATFLISQTLLYLTIPLYPAKELQETTRNRRKMFAPRLRYGIVVVLLTVVTGWGNLYFYQEHILESLDNPLSLWMARLFGYRFIPFTQAGGWFYQSLMVYFLAVISGTKLRLTDYVTFAGMACAGFLVSGSLSLLYNFLVIDLQVLEHNMLISHTIGKFGEGLALILLAFFIYNNENDFSLTRSCIIACLPTVLIILIQLVI